MKRLRRKKTPKKILAVWLSCSLTASLIMGLAYTLAPVVVYAANPFQVGSVILTLLTALNQTPSTSSITNYMSNNSVLSQTITSVEQLEGIDTAIDQALAADLGTARYTAQLSNSAADMRILKEELIGAGADPEKVRLLSDDGATVGQNVKATMKEYLETGELSRSYGGKTLSETGLQTAFGMTALAYEGAKLGNFQAFQEYARSAGLTQEEIDAAVDSGAAFGDPSAFDDYIKEYRKTIIYGVDIDTPSDYLNITPNGYVITQCIQNNDGKYPYRDQKWAIYSNPSDAVACYYYTGNANNPYKVGAINIKYPNQSLSLYYTGEWWGNPSLNGPTGGYAEDMFFSYDAYSVTGAIQVPSDATSRNQLAERWRNGQDVPTRKSPSVTGNDGQLSGSTDSSQSTQPYVINLSPIYNVNNYNVNPIPTLQEYSGLVDTLEQNVEDNLSNDNIVKPFIDPFLVPRTVIDNPVDPDPQPTTAPNPITPIPSVIPPQPTAAPLPTLAPEDETEVPKYMNQPDLTSKFPFCIPFDLALIFALFNSDVRQAPVFDWELNFGPAGTYNIHIDFSPYDPAAALFRLLMLIFFVFSLALGTHRLIHPEGP